MMSQIVALKVILKSNARSMIPRIIVCTPSPPSFLLGRVVEPPTKFSKGGVA